MAQPDLSAQVSGTRPSPRPWRTWLVLGLILGLPAALAVLLLTVAPMKGPAVASRSLDVGNLPVVLATGPGGQPLTVEDRSKIREAYALEPSIRAYGRWKHALAAAMDVTGHLVELEDGTTGFQVAELAPASLWNATLHLVPGDVVVSVNGQALPESVKEARSMFERLAKEREFLLRLVRDQEQYYIYYKVEGVR